MCTATRRAIRICYSEHPAHAGYSSRGVVVLPANPPLMSASLDHARSRGVSPLMIKYKNRSKHNDASLPPSFCVPYSVSRFDFRLSGPYAIHIAHHSPGPKPTARRRSSQQQPLSSCTLPLLYHQLQRQFGFDHLSTEPPWLPSHLHPRSRTRTHCFTTTLTAPLLPRHRRRAAPQNGRKAVPLANPTRKTSASRIQNPGL